MAIKALKQTVSISEMQKMIHQWKKRGINDPTITKLLDLYLGMPAYMNIQGMYPLCNFYDIRLSLRFAYTSTLITAVTNCQSFGMVWDDTHTKIIAFYSPLWHQKKKETPQDSAQKTPQDLAFNNNIIYNINNIYPPEDSRKGDPDGKHTPDKAENTKADPSPATEFFHRLNTTPEDKKQVLVPIIDRIAAGRNYTRPRALQTLVILVNRFLIPHFDSNPRFDKSTHTGRIIWLKNLMKTSRGQAMLEQAAARMGQEVEKELEEKRRTRRAFRPISPAEWKAPDSGTRYYDDPIDGKVEIPGDAPPRPTETAIWNVLSHEWIDTAP